MTPCTAARHWPASLPGPVRMKISIWREPGSLELRVGLSGDTSSIDVTHAVAGCGRTRQTVRPRGSERDKSVTSPQSALNLTLRVAAAIAEFSEA